MNIKIFKIGALILTVVLLFSCIAAADPGKGKKKGHKKAKTRNSTKVAVVEKKPRAQQNVIVVNKKLVEKRYLPNQIINWTSVNSPVYSYKCPFSCATEGIPKKHCRDWREGSVCFVQDTSLNTYDYTAGRYLSGPSAGEVVGQKIDQTIAEVLR